MMSSENLVAFQSVVFDIASIVLTATAGLKIVKVIWFGRNRRH
jgi:hypothetical protein